MKSLKIKEKMKSFIPHRIYRDYSPYILRVRWKQQPYNAEEFFESYWKATEGFEDRCTISPQKSELHARIHYNLVENNIIEFLVDHNCNVTTLDVLDI